MRLTIRNSDGTVSQPMNLDWSAALEKLAAYEDTGYSPPEIKSLESELNAARAKVGDTVTVTDLVRELNKPKWTPVTEGLPVERINPYTRDFEFVLCRTIWGDVRPFKYGAQIGQKKAHFWNGAGYVDAYVTHWMQLPTPPKEET